MTELRTLYRAMLATKGARKKLLKELVPAYGEVHLKAKQPVSHKFSVVIRLIFVENRKRAVYRAERCSGGSKAGDRHSRLCPYRSLLQRAPNVSTNIL